MIPERQTIVERLRAQQERKLSDVRHWRKIAVRAHDTNKTAAEANADHIADIAQVEADLAKDAADALDQHPNLVWLERDELRELQEPTERLVKLDALYGRIDKWLASEGTDGCIELLSDVFDLLKPMPSAPPQDGGPRT